MGFMSSKENKYLNIVVGVCTSTLSKFFQLEAKDDVADALFIKGEPEVHSAVPQKIVKEKPPQPEVKIRETKEQWKWRERHFEKNLQENTKGNASTYFRNKF